MLIQDLRPQTLSCLHTRYAPDTSRLTASAWNALKSRLPCVGSPQAPRQIDDSFAANVQESW